MTVSQVALGEVLERVNRPVPVVPAESFRFMGVRSFGVGAFDAGEREGSEMSYSLLQVVHEGDFVYPKLMAWEGAFAVVPPELDGRFVSPEFCLFRPLTEKLDLAFLGYLFRWSGMWERVAGASIGTNLRRRRLYPDDFLSRTIPLPTIAEQSDIVRDIQKAVGRMALVTQHSSQMSARALAVASSLAIGAGLGEEERSKRGWKPTALAEVLAAAADPVKVAPMTEYPNVGVFSFARGLFEKPPIDGSNTSARSLYRIHSGQFIYSRLFAFEGAYASVPDRFDGYYVSNEFPAFDVDTERTDLRFLTAYFSAPGVWERVAEGSKGLGVRRQRVQQEQLLNHVLWMPPLEEQRRIGRVAGWLGEVGRLRARASVLADAIEPAALNRAFAGLV